MNNKLIQKYNTKDTLLVISLYPKKGETYSEGVSGVASYAKNVIRHMNRPVIVLADKNNTNEVIYEEGNVLVIRCFNNNSLRMWKQLFSAIRTFDTISSVLIQYDFTMYGGVLTSGFVLPFLAVLKLFGKKTYITIHSVVTDVRKLSGHVGLKSGLMGVIQAYIYNKLFHGFYWFLANVVHAIIVLEKLLEQSLSHLIPTSKVVTIPHGVDVNISTITKHQARKELGIPMQESVILFFGFVNWFKGADIFIDSFSEVDSLLGKKVRIILAGGESTTLKNKQYYQEYFNNILKDAYSAKHVEITGYVSQNKISSYFSAADLIVFPYREMMMASGVLSLAFSYKRPFIVSKAMGDMFRLNGYQSAFNQSNLKISDATFSLNKASCLKTTERVMKNGLKQKLVSVARIMRKIRSYENTAQLYERVLFA